MTWEISQVTTTFELWVVLLLVLPVLTYWSWASQPARILITRTSGAIGLRPHRAARRRPDLSFSNQWTWQAWGLKGAETAAIQRLAWRRLRNNTVLSRRLKCNRLVLLQNGVGVKCAVKLWSHIIFPFILFSHNSSGTCDCDNIIRYHLRSWNASLQVQKTNNQLCHIQLPCKKKTNHFNNPQCVRKTQKHSRTSHESGDVHIR